MRPPMTDDPLFSEAFDATPTLDAFLFDDLVEPVDPLESDTIPTARALRLSARRRFERIGQKQALNTVIGDPPAAGESIHVISAAKFDFWTWTPAMLDWIGRADSLFCSTWTLNRSAALELFELWDAGRIGQVGFLTGLYFKRRETAVYTILLTGIRARGGTYRAFRNHAKILLLANQAKDVWLTVEGSANLTANPRAEQYVITNDRALHDFYRAWFEEMLATIPAEPIDDGQTEKNQAETTPAATGRTGRPRRRTTGKRRKPRGR